MPPIDPSPASPANESPVAQALHRILNPGPSGLDCHCGHCPLNEDTADVDRAVDVALRDALNLVESMTGSQLARDAGDLLTLHSLQGLLSQARLMCCVQRYAARPRDRHEV